MRIFMGFKRIDLNTWERKEKYNYFTTEEQCEISLTCDIDVTEFVSFCKENARKFYTGFICVVSRVINGDEHYKMGYNENGELVVYDSVFPCYTDFVPECNDFSTMVTAYSPDMKALYSAIESDRKKHKNIPCAFPETDVPNMFCISALPWVNYSNLNLHYYNDWAGLAPLVFWGKYVKKEGRLMLPVTIQVRHAVCDGYHVSKFFLDIEKTLPQVMKELAPHRQNLF